MNMLNRQPRRTAFHPFSLISRDELKHLSWDEHLTDAEIADMYRVSSIQVHQMRQKMNLIHGQITSEQLTDIVRLSEQIKSLPLEAIDEIRAIVERYRH